MFTSNWVLSSFFFLLVWLIAKVTEYKTHKNKTKTKCGTTCIQKGCANILFSQLDSNQISSNLTQIFIMLFLILVVNTCDTCIIRCKYIKPQPNAMHWYQTKRNILYCICSYINRMYYIESHDEEENDFKPRRVKQKKHNVSMVWPY